MQSITCQDHMYNFGGGKVILKFELKKKKLE